MISECISAHEQPLQLFVPSLWRLSDNPQRNCVAVSVFSVTINSSSLNDFNPVSLPLLYKIKAAERYRSEAPAATDVVDCLLQR